MSGGKRSYEENSQQAQALIFPRAYPSTTRLVTFTIGGIDVTRWLTAPDPVMCAQAAVRTLAANLGQLLSNEHAAAPGATIVETSNSDPFLARRFAGPDLASLSTSLQAVVNGTIAAVT